MKSNSNIDTGELLRIRDRMEDVRGELITQKENLKTTLNDIDSLLKLTQRYAEFANAKNLINSSISERIDLSERALLRLDDFITSQVKEYNITIDEAYASLSNFLNSISDSMKLLAKF